MVKEISEENARKITKSRMDCCTIYTKSLRGSLNNKTREWKLCVRSEEDKERILRSCHESQSGGHLGRDKTTEKICSRFYWGRNMHSEIHEFVKSCERCQRNNDVFHKPHSTLRPIPVPGVVWQQIGIDVVTMPTSKMGNKYIITCVDYFSKWPEAAASKDKSAVSVANFIFETICRFGCAKVVITDQGREFVNSINEELMSLTGTNHRITSAYHPQSNGLVERFNQTLQNSLRKCSLKSSDDWDSLLPSVLFAIRTSVQKSTKYTPFQLMFNRQPVLPIEFELKGQLSNADMKQSLA